MDKVNYSFQKKVVKHLRDEGFNCVPQPSPEFPNIIAWRPFVNGSGDVLAISVNETFSGKVGTKTVLPFYVAFIECREKKALSKKEEKIAKLNLEEGRCNTFLLANTKNKKVVFKEITLNNKEVIPVGKTLPSYVG